MKKFQLTYLVLVIVCALPDLASSQCGVGETPLNLGVQTDDWGYETYWQITNQGSLCGETLIAEGGNTVQVGCSGGGDQVATTAQGYGDNLMVMTENICLTVGATYTLHYVDDYGDGGASFHLEIFGLPMFEFVGVGNGGSFDFQVIEPPQYDIAGQKVKTYSYINPGANSISGLFFNYGSETITEVEFSYRINGGAAVASVIQDLSVSSYNAFELIHPIAWESVENGAYELEIWVSAINGAQDLNAVNDIVSRSIIIGPPIPNLLDDYIGFTPMVEEIAGMSEGIVNPRDLDFHPILTRNELWVVLKSTEDSGGKTVKLSNAGTANQTELVQQDGNAWHFMSLPTGIAFSKNENFATSPGVYDSNHDGGQPFTGPALWSSDPLIYAQESGGNGSHLDMLHESPYSMGIANETDNKFWVTCGDHNEVMSYDFGEDHGPGNSDHADGIIYKYPIPGYNEDTQHEIPDHLVYDDATGWLYVCNSQQNRVIRINTNSGTPGADAVPHEATEVYKYMEDFIWEEFITEGLNKPSGIDIVEDRLIVSNYENGDVHIYDISQDQPVLVTSIPTGAGGIMGVKVGPTGHIWYVNSNTDKVMRIAFMPVGVGPELRVVDFAIFPNPATTKLFVEINGEIGDLPISLRMVDGNGNVILEEIIMDLQSELDISKISSGAYQLIISKDSRIYKSRTIIIQ
jgi:hypothetical protein